METLHLYRHGASEADVTKWVTRMSWGRNVSSPWGGISASLTLPFQEWLSGAFPLPGDWLVVRDRGKAVAWGRVVPASSGVEAAAVGGVFSGTVSVRAEPWLKFLDSCMVYVAEGITSAVGTLMPLSEWTRIFDALVSGFNGDIGRALQNLFGELARQVLPGALSGKSSSKDGENLHEAVSVVYNNQTQEALADDFLVEAVPGRKLPDMNRRAYSGSSVGAILRGLAIPDQNLVELFPSLSDGSGGRIPRTAAQEREEKRRLSEEWVKARDFANMRNDGVVGGGVRSSLNPLVRVPTEDEYQARYEPDRESESATAKVLGTNPILVYRMRPWRSKDLSSFLSSDLSASAKARVIDTAVFQDTTWDALASTAEAFTAYSFSFQWSDADRVNAIGVNLPTQSDLQLGFWEKAGFPLANKDDIRRNGLRYWSPSWPFFATKSETNSDDIIKTARTVGAQAAQTMAGGERFAGGTATGAYAPKIREGSVIELVAAPAKGVSVMTAYVDGFEHSMVVDQKTGNTYRMTTVTFSRGLFDEGIRGGNFSLPFKRIKL